tara:strand:+ start:373 stop:885 length:513 start_codon:yes stop_codon:yes gene_type:complete
MAKNGRKRKSKTKRKRASKPKKKVSRIKSQWSKISAGAGTLAALSNITSQDMALSTGQPIAARAKNFSNSILGRIVGFTPFKDAAGANTPQTISLEGIFNKYTGIGLGLLGYAMIPAKILPHKSKARILGKSLFGAGLISGIFSPTGNPHTHSLVQSHTVAPMVTNAGVT